MTTPRRHRQSDELHEEIDGIDWYHTLELAPGVVTPGWLDTRRVASQVPFGSLEGKRCLDIGTFNGFWAFEMERLGADEVIGIDVLNPLDWDWPVGSDEATIEAVGERHAEGLGFEIAKRELSSSVQRIDRSVYELTEEELGQFDLIYIGSLLIHLRDPVAALESVRKVCRGELIVMDGIDPFLSLLFRRQPLAVLNGKGRPWWWYPNTAALARMIEAAGFVLEAPPLRVNIPPGEGWSPSRTAFRGLTHREGRYRLYVAWRGDPHAVIRARPG